jgi:hypothetical protein
MPFIHHSCRPIGEVCDSEQTLNDSAGAKPDGLWFSIGDGADWIKLCKKANGWCLDVLNYQTEIVFSESANILRLASAEDIDAFTAAYVMNSAATKIDWRRVAQKFGGIIIAPHVDERSNHENTRWYYHWEIASGCVWRKSAVKCLRLLKHKHPARS